MEVDNKAWQVLSHEEKNHQLFLRQKATLGWLSMDQSIFLLLIIRSLIKSSETKNALREKFSERKSLHED